MRGESEKVKFFGESRDRQRVFGLSVYNFHNDRIEHPTHSDTQPINSDAQVFRCSCAARSTRLINFGVFLSNFSHRIFSCRRVGFSLQAAGSAPAVMGGSSSSPADG